MAYIDDYPLLKEFSKNTDGSYHSADIKAEIEKRGTNLTKLSINAGLHPKAVSNALKQPLKSGELALAEFFCVPVQYLFPTRWDIKGNRVRPRYANKYITVAKALS